MIRRMLLLAMAVLLLLAPAAAAQTYGEPGITTSGPLTPGARVTLFACCYVPGTPVAFSVQSATTSQTYTAVADDDGTASVEVTVPADATGTVTLAASGTPLPGYPANTDVEVTVGESPAAGAVAGTGALPVTGTDSTLPLSIIAVLLLAGGGAALLASRRDERDSEPFGSL